MKSDKSKYYDITYIQNLKNTTNELAKQKQTHRKKQTKKFLLFPETNKMNPIKSKK